jgi:hypothetical protein
VKELAVAALLTSQNPPFCLESLQNLANLHGARVLGSIGAVNAEHRSSGAPGRRTSKSSKAQSGVACTEWLDGFVRPPHARPNRCCQAKVWQTKSHDEIANSRWQRATTKKVSPSTARRALEHRGQKRETKQSQIGSGVTAIGDSSNTKSSTNHHGDNLGVHPGATEVLARKGSSKKPSRSRTQREYRKSE